MCVIFKKTAKPGEFYTCYNCLAKVEYLYEIHIRIDVCEECRWPVMEKHNYDTVRQKAFDAGLLTQEDIDYVAKLKADAKVARVMMAELREKQAVCEHEYESYPDDNPMKLLKDKDRYRCDKCKHLKWEDKQ